MQMTLKRKYRTINEFDSWKDRAKHKSFKQFGSGREGQGVAKQKGVLHPIGVSGRTLGTMQRRFRDVKASNPLKGRK